MIAMAVDAIGGCDVLVGRKGTGALRRVLDMARATMLQTANHDAIGFLTGIDCGVGVCIGLSMAIDTSHHQMRAMSEGGALEPPLRDMTGLD